MEFEIEADEQNSSLETVNIFLPRHYEDYFEKFTFAVMIFDMWSRFQTVILHEFLVLLQNATEVRLVGHYVEGANTLGLIAWSFIFGLTLNRMGEKGRILVEVLTRLNEATKCVVSLILG